MFGHTHQPATALIIKLRSNRQVTVVNDGAFQRLISPAVLDRIAKDKAETARRIRSASRRRTSPCYSAVLIRTGNVQKIELDNWKMKESDSSGAWVDICDPACGRIAEACKSRQ